MSADNTISIRQMPEGHYIIAEMVSIFPSDCRLSEDEIDEMFREDELDRAETYERAIEIANYIYDSWWDSGHPVEYGVNEWKREDDIMSIYTDAQKDYLVNAKYHVEMPDGSVWAVPVKLVARNRAEHYDDEFGGKMMVSMAEDTLPLFMSDPYEVHDWASGNMNWSDVEDYAKCVKEPEEPDFQQGWINGEWEVIPPSDGE